MLCYHRPLPNYHQVDHLVMGHMMMTMTGNYQDHQQGHQQGHLVEYLAHQLMVQVILIVMQLSVRLWRMPEYLPRLLLEVNSQEVNLLGV